VFHIYLSLTKVYPGWCYRCLCAEHGNSYTAEGSFPFMVQRVACRYAVINLQKLICVSFFPFFHATHTHTHTHTHLRHRKYINNIEDFIFLIPLKWEKVYLFTTN